MIICTWSCSGQRHFAIVNRQCYQPVPLRFTVHGLWPQLSGGGINCRNRRKYESYPPFNSRQVLYVFQIQQILYIFIYMKFKGIITHYPPVVYL